MPTVTSTFTYTGTLQQVAIPAGTTTIDMYLWGGAGGGGGGGESDIVQSSRRAQPRGAPRERRAMADLADGVLSEAHFDREHAVS